jgi:TetR/AcrR family transcriptional repressor of nem operon
MQPAAKDTDTREKLLEAGAQAISAKSFNSCGLAEILSLAGVPKGSFYHYFASKEDFGVALIDRACADYVELLHPVLSDTSRTPIERLRTVFEQSRDECVATGAARQCLVPKLALETSQLSEPVHAAVKRAYDKWCAMIAEAIREAQAVGEVAPGQDADRLANVLVMLWEGATIRMQIDRSLQPVEDFFTFVFDSLLKDRR